MTDEIHDYGVVAPAAFEVFTVVGHSESPIRIIMSHYRIDRSLSGGRIGKQL